ncbi:hypothetical protein OF83DRAFT_886781 [Amylostereum chailletii]|nr:hypothetical protein OF83DRAFT_886781 [Amylostereum chailletii]
MYRDLPPPRGLVNTKPGPPSISYLCTVLSDLCCGRARYECAYVCHACRTGGSLSAWFGANAVPPLELLVTRVRARRRCGLRGCHGSQAEPLKMLDAVEEGSRAQEQGDAPCVSTSIFPHRRGGLRYARPSEVRRPPSSVVCGRSSVSAPEPTSGHHAVSHSVLSPGLIVATHKYRASTMHPRHCPLVFPVALSASFAAGRLRECSDSFSFLAIRSGHSFQPSRYGRGNCIDVGICSSRIKSLDPCVPFLRQHGSLCLTPSSSFASTG